MSKKLYCTRKGQLDKLRVGEVYFLWKLLINRYIYIDRIQEFNDFTIHEEFKVLLKNLVDDWKKEAKLLEDQLGQISEKGHQPKARNQNTTEDCENVSDMGIAKVVNTFLRLDIQIFFSGNNAVKINNSI